MPRCKKDNLLLIVQMTINYLFYKQNCFIHLARLGGLGTSGVDGTIIIISRRILEQNENYDCIIIEISVVYLQVMKRDY